jgi:chemotaxis signal transduction protein
MEDCNAWMVPLAGEHRAAVGELELVHVLPDPPELFTVLKAPTHCRKVFLWEGHVLPVFDLSQWLGEEPADIENTHIGVFRYRPGPGEALRYGGLILQGAPRQVLVNDSQACNLPSGEQAWRQVACACFDYGGRPVPVLNLPRIFGHALQS